MGTIQSFVQSYETLIRDNTTALAARILVIPRRSLSNPEAEILSLDARSEAEHLISSLGCWEIAEIPPEKLVTIVAAVVSEMPKLSGEITDFNLQERKTFVTRDLLLNQPKFTSDDFNFAVALVNQPLVPFEQSPLQAVSLGGIAKAGGVATGAYIGIVIAHGTPLLLITVPLGMIICGAAAGIGEGLRRRFETLLSGHSSPKGPRPKSRKKGK